MFWDTQHMCATKGGFKTGIMLVVTPNPNSLQRNILSFFRSKADILQLRDAATAMTDHTSTTPNDSSEAMPQVPIENNYLGQQAGIYTSPEYLQPFAELRAQPFFFFLSVFFRPAIASSILFRLA
jgi:hypothetical protein